MPILIPMAGVKLVFITLRDIADRLQPVIDDAVAVSVKRGADAAAAAERRISALRGA